MRKNIAIPPAAQDGQAAAGPQAATPGAAPGGMPPGAPGKWSHGDKRLTDEEDCYHCYYFFSYFLLIVLWYLFIGE